MKLTSEDGDFNQIWSYLNDHDDDELYAAYFTLKSIRNIAIDAYWIYINGHGGFAHNSGANSVAGASSIPASARTTTPSAPASAER